jgi:hypothetical protein
VEQQKSVKEDNKEEKLCRGLEGRKDNMKIKRKKMIEYQKRREKIRDGTGEKMRMEKEKGRGIERNM